MNNLNGTWLMIKTADDYDAPEFVEFKNDIIQHFYLENDEKDESIKINLFLQEDSSNLKIEFINRNRVRVFRMGKTHTGINENESVTEDTEFKTDYERILPTKTDLPSGSIEKITFKGKWNNEIIHFAFNTVLDSPSIKAINERLNREGRKMRLERYKETYFASLFDNGKRRILIGIREVDKKNAILFGFPEPPFEIIAK